MFRRSRFLTVLVAGSLAACSFGVAGGTTTPAFALGVVINSISPAAPVLTVTGATCTSNTATLTFASTAAPTIGSAIIVAGMTPTGYNGNYIASNSSATTVSYSPINSSGAFNCPGTFSSGGTVTIAVARPGDVITAYGTGFGATEPTGGSCPAQGGCGISVTDTSPGFGQNSPEKWGQSGNASTIVVNSWSSTQVSFTVPVPSGTANQWRLEPGTIATFCITDNTTNCLSVAQNLPINYSDNERDYYDAIEHVGISSAAHTDCQSQVMRIDSSSTTSGNFYVATGSHSLGTPDSGTALTAGGIYTDGSTHVSYVWPDATTCTYDDIDGAVTPYFEDIQMPPNTGAGAVTELGLMGTGISGGYSLTATIIYADGTTSTAPLDFSDWCGSAGSGTDLVNSSIREPANSPDCNIFQRADVLTAGKAVRAIEIPTAGAGNMRIFAFALDECSASPCTSGNAQTYPWLLWNHPGDVTYGTQLSATQLDATAPDVAGSFAYSPVSGTTPNAGTDALSATFTPSGPTASDWVGGTTATTTITVLKANQSITFNSIPTHTFGDADFNPAATASSGLSVSYIASGNCTIVSGLVHITAAGSCTVTASQSGNSNYNSSSNSPQQTFTINPASQSISFNTIPSHTYGDVFTASATGGGSGNPITFTATGNCTATGTNGTTITTTGAGACTVYADQAGNSNYNAAPEQSQGFSIGQASLSVTSPSVGVAAGGDIPSLSPIYGSFVGSDNAGSLGTAPTCSTAAGSAGSPVPAPPPYSYPTSCSGGSDTNYSFNYSGGTLTINTDTMAYSGDTTVTDGANGTLSATLTDAQTSDPVVGKSVTLTLAPALSGGQSCTATTDSSGVASCVLSPVNVSDGTRSVSAFFAGDSSYPAATTTTNVTVNPQPTDTLTYTGDTTMSNGTTANLSASLVDGNSNPIVGRTINFTLAPSQNAQTCSGVTNISGIASCSIVGVNEPAGSRTVYVAYGGDTYDANYVNAPVTVNNGTADNLSYTGVTTIADGSNTVVTASLTDANTSVGITGDTLTFALAPALTNQTCTATTDSNGNASCTIYSVSTTTGSRDLRVSFDGDGTYPANQTDATVTVTPGFADTVSYTGTTSIVDQNNVVVTANLKDANTSVGISGDSVTITLAPALSDQSCTGTTDSNGNVSCTIYNVSSGDDGSRDMRVSFEGDGTYPANQVDTTVSVTAAKADTLAYTGPTTGANSSPVTFTATLTDPNNGNAPIVGDTISFQLGPAQPTPATCSGVTDGTGTVTCTTSALSMSDGARTLVLTFNGDGTYASTQQTDIGEVTVSG